MISVEMSTKNKLVVHSATAMFPASPVHATLSKSQTTRQKLKRGPHRVEAEMCEGESSIR